MTQLQKLALSIVATVAFVLCIVDPAPACPPAASSSSVSRSRTSNVDRVPFFQRVFGQRSKTVTKTTATANAVAVPAAVSDSQSSLDTTITNQELESTANAFAALTPRAMVRVPVTTFAMVPAPQTFAMAAPTITSQSTTVTRGRVFEPRPARTSETTVTRSRTRSN